MGKCTCECTITRALRVRLARRTKPATTPRKVTPSTTPSFASRIITWRNVCTACPAGHAHAGGDVQHGPDTSCDEVLCHTNERVQDHQCVACPPGSTNAAGDGVASGNTQCDSTICGANRYVSNHVCVLCPYQHYRAAGDDATGPDTACIRYYLG